MIEEKKEKCIGQSEEQFNIQEILFRCLVHWPWFVFSVIVCMPGAEFLIIFVSEKTSSQ